MHQPRRVQRGETGQDLAQRNADDGALGAAQVARELGQAVAARQVRGERAGALVAPHQPEAGGEPAAGGLLSRHVAAAVKGGDAAARRFGGADVHQVLHVAGLYGILLRVWGVGWGWEGGRRLRVCCCREGVNFLWWVQISRSNPTQPNQ